MGDDRSSWSMHLIELELSYNHFQRRNVKSICALQVFYQLEGDK